MCIVSFNNAQSIKANVTAVSATGTQGTYRFFVTVKSDETGCEQFANWWEVLNAKGELLYRRILVHSHPDTQPFTRSGGRVDIKEDELVYVRAHMNSLGYVGDVLVGSIAKGFVISTTTPNFSSKIETQKPLPTGCLY
jgi:hypothetical protein